LHSLCGSFVIAVQRMMDPGYSLLIVYMRGLLVRMSVGSKR
jgi:hypothetical protein